MKWKILILLFIVIVVSSYTSAISIDIPTNVRTKMQSGINITVDDFSNQIYSDHSDHYYKIRFVLFSSTAQMNNRSIAGTFNLRNYAMYPVISNYTYNITLDNYTKYYTHYETGNSTTTINASRYKDWILEITTPNWEVGAFNVTVGASFIDPDVSACGFLNTANSVYNLTKTIQINSSTCFTLNNTGITLDCKGYLLLGNRTSLTNGIALTVGNSTIKNCYIQDFANDISITSNNNYIYNNTLGNASSYALYSTGGTRLNTTVTSNIIYSVISTSIRLFNLSNNVIENNISVSAVVTNSGNDSYYEYNNITSSGTIHSISNNNNKNSIYRYNRFIASGSAYIFSISSNATNNSIYNNTLNFVTGRGLQISNGTLNYFYNNQLNYTSGTGIYYIAGGTTNNYVYANNFTSTTGVYIYDLNGTNYYNYTLNGENIGNIYMNVINNSVVITGNTTSINYPTLYIGNTGAGYPYTNTTSLNKFQCHFVGCADYAPLTRYLTSGNITDTCTYGGSGIWYIKVSDNCTLATQTINNTIVVNGTGGTLTINGDVRAKNFSITPSAFTGNFIFRILSGKSFGVLK